MGSLVAAVGALWIAVIMWDAFEAIVLPRRVTRRLRPARMFYRMTWRVWSAVPRRMRPVGRRETFLSFYGPLSLLVLLAAWAASLITAFAMVQAGIGTRLNVEGDAAFLDHLYLSGETFFTLGLGDVTPMSRAGRAITVIEAGVGFGFLALVIGYLPVLYQSFSRRELNITLLDARAGSPPSAEELLRGFGADHEELTVLLAEWERWAAEVLESHLSYPVLSYYRSQHDNQSWLAALTTVLDASVLVMVGIEGACGRQAGLTGRPPRTKNKGGRRAPPAARPSRGPPRGARPATSTRPRTSAPRRSTRLYPCHTERGQASPARGLTGSPRLLPVMRDEGRTLPEPLGKHLFEGSRHRGVQRDALLEELRSVGDLLGERMAEHVLGLALAVDELRALERRERRVDVAGGEADDVPQDTLGEALADHGRCLEHELVLLRETVHACREQ